MIDIDAIKADREAGTPGPWEAELFFKAKNNDGSLHESWKIARVQRSVYGTILPEDARRIARVPDLEDAVIASKEREDALLARVAELEIDLNKVASLFETASIRLKVAEEEARAALAKPGDAP